MTSPGIFPRPILFELMEGNVPIGHEKIMNCQEYRELTAAHVDGALSAGETVEVQSHLDRCPKCQRLFLWETDFKKLLRQNLAPISVRPSFKEALLERLEGKRKRAFMPWVYQRYGIGAVMALLLLAIAPLLFFRNEAGEKLFSQAAAQYQMATRNIAENPSLSPTRAARSSFDLSPWGYRLLTSEAAELNGLIGITSTYRNEQNDYVLAQEFRGGQLSAPPGAKIVRVAGKTFVLHSDNGVNLIAWKEQTLLCILASRAPMDQLLDIAQRVMA